MVATSTTNNNNIPTQIAGQQQNSFKTRTNISSINNNAVRNKTPYKSIFLSGNQKQLDVIKIKADNVKNSEIQLLLDTGADVSLLKESSLISN